MKARCDDVNHQAYERYGGRGITYCPEWASFEEFYGDMGNSNGLTLDRINVEDGYYKENCQWATRLQQSFNKRKASNKSSEYKGVSFIKKESKYKGTFNSRGHYYHLGYSEDPELLACRYDVMLERFGENTSGGNYSLGLTDKQLYVNYPEDKYLERYF